MITGMDRLMAAVKGTKSDRVPVFCNLFDQGAKELGMPIQDYYSNGEYVAEAQLRMRERYGHDNLWSLFYVGKEAELLGCRDILFSSDGPPNVVDIVIKSMDDIGRLEVPDDITSHPAFAEPLKCLRILKSEAGGRYPICAYLTASMSLPAILMGMERWMELLLAGPSGARDELISKCSDFFRKEIAAYRAAGADVLVYSDPFGSTDIIPERLFRELSLGWIKRDLADGGTEGVVYYVGGARLNSVLGMVLDETGIGVYYPGPLDDLAESKRIIGGRALCAGVINDIRMIDWSAREVREEVKRIMDIGMPGGHFFFGTVVMPFGIPDENIRVMVEAACEFGSLSDNSNT